jgi:hypothetical protein
VSYSRYGLEKLRRGLYYDWAAKALVVDWGYHGRWTIVYCWKLRRPQTTLEARALLFDVTDAVRADLYAAPSNRPWVRRVEDGFPTFADAVFRLRDLFY